MLTVVQALMRTILDFLIKQQALDVRFVHALLSDEPSEGVVLSLEIENASYRQGCRRQDSEKVIDGLVVKDSIPEHDVKIDQR